MKKTMLFFLVLCVAGMLSAQESDVASVLTLIDQGKLSDARTRVSGLLATYPADPSVLYADALLTEDAVHASEKYKLILNAHPNSRYEDAVFYRLYSYFTAVGGVDQNADQYRSQLQKKYPASPYTRMLEPGTVKSDEKKEVEIVAEEKKEEQKEERKEEQKQGTRYGGKDDAKKKSKGKFMLQAGFFSIVANADRLQSKLTKAGFEVVLKPKELNGKKGVTVFVGPYETKTEANSSAQVLKERYEVETMLVEQ